MPTYQIKFEIIRRRGERLAELLEEKKEVVMAKNKSYAQLYILNKYMDDGTKDRIKFNEIEVLIDNSNFYGRIH